jgi:hypothetical protein
VVGCRIEPQMWLHFRDRLANESNNGGVSVPASPRNCPSRKRGPPARITTMLQPPLKESVKLQTWKCVVAGAFEDCDGLWGSPSDDYSTT